MFFKNFCFFITLLTIAALISCNKDKDGDTSVSGEPRISLMVNGSESIKDFTADAGDTITISGTVDAERIIASFSGTASFGTTSDNLVVFGGDSVSTQFVIDPIQYVIHHTASGEEITFFFTLQDRQETGDTVEFYVQVNESPIQEATGNLLAGFGHSTYGNIFNVMDDTVYFPSNVKILERNQEGSDMIFAYSFFTGWQVLSIDDNSVPDIWNESVSFNWPFFVENSTRFATLPGGFNYEEIKTASQLDGVFAGSGTSSLDSLVTGQVVAFKLDRDKGEKIGIFQIESVTGNKDSNRSMVLNVKVQK